MSIEQQEIVRRVEGLFALADQLEVRLAKARGQVEAEFDTSSGLWPPSPRSRRRRETLLARAFADKLVRQDPTDEPAEKLLERIRANNGAAKVAQAGKRGKA